MKIQKKLYSALLLALCIVPMVQASYKGYGSYTPYDPYVNYYSRHDIIDMLFSVGIMAVGSFAMVSMLVYLDKNKPVEISAPLHPELELQKLEGKERFLMNYEVQIILNGTQEQYEDFCFEFPLKIELCAKIAPEKHARMLERAEDIPGGKSPLQDKYFEARSREGIKDGETAVLGSTFKDLAVCYTEAQEESVKSYQERQRLSERDGEDALNLLRADARAEEQRRAQLAEQSLQDELIARRLAAGLE